MEHNRITVIMAVYNAEPYLRRCLDSILAQTLTDFDVILVDDGSTDLSLVIAEEYAQRDKRFRVYHKKNGGVSSARQYGIERLAEQGGKYSIHVDPDDWVEPKMLERLCEKAEETGADMVICDYYSNSHDWQKRYHQNPGSKEPRQVLNALFQGLHGSLCNKLIRTACYSEANIRFPEGLNYCEDYYVNMCLLLKSVRKVAYLSEAFYHYDTFSNPQSETRKGDCGYVDYILTEIVRRCRELVPEDMREWQFHVFERTNAFGIIEHGSMDDAAFREFFDSIPWSLLLRPGCHNLSTILTLLAVHTLLGRKGTSRVYHSYVTVRHRIGKLLGISKS